MDIITDVSGNRKLESQATQHSILLNDITTIIISPLGFTGSPSDLLREHGLLYFHNGQNALKLEKDNFNPETTYSLMLEDVSILEMTVRTANRLDMNDITIIAQLTDMTENELIDKIGYASTCEVKDSLSNIGLSLST